MQTRKMRYIRFAVSCFLITAVASSLAIVIAVSSNAPKAFAMPLTEQTPTPVATSTAEVAAFVTPGVLSMYLSGQSGPDSTTLNGTDQRQGFDLVFYVGDNSGSGAGWNLTASMTQFDNGGHKLSTSAVSAIAVVEDSCVSDSCTDPSNSVGYDLPVPSNGRTTTKFYNAAVNTGMGEFYIDSSFGVTIPDTAYAGTYSSTMTISITSGP